MITIETLVLEIEGLAQDDVVALIEQDCLRPVGPRGGPPDAWLFRDIDIARLRLILDLRRQLSLEDTALPVVLNLLDQLYATRRRLMRLRSAVEQAAPPEVRDAVLAALKAPPD